MTPAGYQGEKRKFYMMQGFTYCKGFEKGHA
jgi:hypothetical protein